MQNQHYFLLSSIRIGLRTALPTVALFGMLACGDSGQPRHGKRIGDEGSHHHGTESIALLELENREFGVSLDKVDNVPVDEASRDLPVSNVNRLTAQDQSNLYAQFVKYPGSVISARTYHSSLFGSRDDCLQACFNNEICGSATYVPLISQCSLHGPNMSWDKLHSVPITTSAGQGLADTYVIPTRKGASAYDANYILSFTAGNHGIPGAVYIKFLYTDMTASPWANRLPLPGDSLRKLESVGSSGDMPFKDVEAMVVAIDKNAGKYSFDAFFNSSWDLVSLSEFGAQDSPASYRFFNYFFELGSDNYAGVTVDPNCADEAGSKCVDMIVLPVMKDADKYVYLRDSDKPYQVLEGYRRQFAY